MTQTTKKVLWSLAFACLVPFAFWIGGFDFDHRQPLMAVCFLLTAWIFIFNYMCFPWRTSHD